MLEGEEESSKLLRLLALVIGWKWQLRSKGEEQVSGWGVGVGRHFEVLRHLSRAVFQA